MALEERVCEFSEQKSDSIQQLIVQHCCHCARLVVPAHYVNQTTQRLLQDYQVL